MNKSIKLTTHISLLLSFLKLAPQVFAGSVPVNVSSRLDIGTFFLITDIGSLISGVIGMALVVGALAFILYFAMSAFNWTTAGGDKSKVEAAKQRMTNATVGLTLIAATWAIYLLVIYILGLPINTV